MPLVEEVPATMVVESRAAKGDKGLATIYTVSLSATLRWQGPRVAVVTEDDLRQALHPLVSCKTNNL